MNADVLIIGSGLAGMASALYLAEIQPDLLIMMVSKAKADESNTLYAQGGIAGVVQTVGDSFEQHIEDTMEAGHYLSNRAIVELVVKAAPDSIKDLEEWGVTFDYADKGVYALGLEGGHSAHRILHHKDSIGREIYTKLNEKVKRNPNIELINNCAALKLNTTSDNELTGAKFLNLSDNKLFNITAQKTILASGGIGRIFGHTTNPEVATADGLAMAIRAGAELRNMRFVQFHPTLFYKESKEKSFLISEAVRGYGALLRNTNGERFMPKYDTRAELATRDVVCEGIVKELLRTKHPCVYLDCRDLEANDFKSKFPFIVDKCREEGYNISTDLIPVVPAAHYHCGGLAVNKYGQTSVEDLYAVGEVAETGLHGKNRLASNSLLEAVVFAKRLAIKITQEIKHLASEEIVMLNSECNRSTNFDELAVERYLTELQLYMSDFVSASGNKEALIEIKKKILYLQQRFSFDFATSSPNLKIVEVKNMLLVAEKIVMSRIVH